MSAGPAAVFLSGKPGGGWPGHMFGAVERGGLALFICGLRFLVLFARTHVLALGRDSVAGNA